jgi:hypothetical protein
MSIESLIKINFETMSKEDLVNVAIGLYNNQSAMLKYLKENNNEQRDFSIQRNEVEEVENVHSNILTMSEDCFKSLENKRTQYHCFKTSFSIDSFSVDIALKELINLKRELRHCTDSSYFDFINYKINCYTKELNKLEFIDFINNINEELFELGGLDKLNNLHNDFQSSWKSIEVEKKFLYKDLCLNNSIKLLSKMFVNSYESGYNEHSYNEFNINTILERI